MSRPIVVGLALRDDDTAPLELAGSLAGLAGVPLMLVSAYPRDSRIVAASAEYLTRVRLDTRDRLEAIARTLRQEHDVSVLAIEGPPTPALREVAVRQDAVAIVVGSTHRGTLGRVLMGDVAVGLLHAARCPVAVAPRDYRASQRGIECIAAAFTDTPDGRAALRGAVEIARASGGSVRSFTVDDWHNAAETWSLIPDLDGTGRTAGETNALARELIPADVPGDAGLLEGDAVAALASVTASVDLLVCGTRGFGALRSVLAHSVSQGLAHQGQCPVLLVPRSGETERTLLPQSDGATRRRKLLPQSDGATRRRKLVAE